MSSGYLGQQTIKYKTYIKTALVESLRDVFSNHVDTLLSKTHVTIDYPRDEAKYPAVIVRFFEREISGAGIAHTEMIPIYTGDTYEGTFKFKHYIYKGDVEFAVYALSSLDRDLIADTLVQTIAFGELTGYTNRFFNRIYTDDENRYPDSVWHNIHINTDKIQGFGETQQPTPWASEDDLIYQTSYRSAVFGDFYSLPPDLPVGLIERVTPYPYIAGVEDVPTGDVNDGAAWQGGE